MLCRCSWSKIILSLGQIIIFSRDHSWVDVFQSAFLSWSLGIYAMKSFWLTLPHPSRWPYWTRLKMTLCLLSAPCGRDAQEMLRPSSLYKAWNAIWTQWISRVTSLLIIARLSWSHILGKTQLEYSFFVVSLTRTSICFLQSDPPQAVTYLNFFGLNIGTSLLCVIKVWLSKLSNFLVSTIAVPTSPLSTGRSEQVLKTKSEPPWLPPSCLLTQHVPSGASMVPH